MTALAERLTPLRRRVRLIIAVALLTGVAATALALLVPTTWTARAVLTTSSTRTPEQDAYLAQGYVAFFNGRSYQERATGAVPGLAGVTFTARSTANSPIIYVEATSEDRAAAVAAAPALAQELRDDVNGGLQTDVADRTKRLQDQVDVLRQRLDLPTTSDGERASIAQSLNSIQGQIANIRADSTNQLKTLQLDGGAARTRRCR